MVRDNGGSAVTKQRANGWQGCRHVSLCNASCVCWQLAPPGARPLSMASVAVMRHVHGHAMMHAM